MAKLKIRNENMSIKENVLVYWFCRMKYFKNIIYKNVVQAFLFFFSLCFFFQRNFESPKYVTMVLESKEALALELFLKNDAKYCLKQEQEV